MNRYTDFYVAKIPEHMARRKTPTRFGQSPNPILRPGASGALLGHATGQNAASPSIAGDPAKLAEQYHRAGRFKEAERLYRDILRGQPNHARVNALLGMLLNREQRYTDAIRHIKKSLKAVPDDVEAWNALGTAYRSNGQLNEAIDAYNEALTRDPAFAGVYNNLGIAYREAGRFDDALAQFETALAIDPNLPEAWNGLARSRRFAEMPAAVEQLKSALDTRKMTDQARKHALFALGKIHDDLGRYDEAFGFYARANEHGAADVDVDRDLALMSSIKEVFDRSVAPQTPNDGQMPTPIFVLGMPRSGTTLVEQILASHPAVEGGGEIHYFSEIARDLGLDRNARTIDPGVVSKIASSAAQYRKGFFRRFAPSGKRIPKRIAAVVDKTPFNFLYLGIIARVLPEARVVHCRRDPLDTGVSVFFTDFAASQPFTNDLSAIGAYINGYRDMMVHWSGIDMLPILELDYEKLVQGQETLTRALIDFCGLDWDDQCLNYHKTQRYISTPSDWQVRQPIYDRSIGRWRNYQAHIEPLRHALEDDKL